ncbi:MAG TPA: hypothetical protein VKB53_03430, partial [Gammaproteobacteria bacterium]|nr:hypothetical protein [Gammaproteobacteria bacterium]
TREEGIWIAPAGIVLICALGAREWRHAEGPPRIIRAALRVLLRAAPAVLMFAAVLGGVAFQNWKSYGIFKINELKSEPFRAAYGSLLRIRHDHWQRYIEFPKDARERAYAVSPAARELYSALEDGPNAAHWRNIGCVTKPCDEIRSGFFIWAFLNAVAQNGHYSSPSNAEAYYRRLAAEINTACDSGQIPCLGRRSTLAPPFRWQYVLETIAATATIGQHLLIFGGGEIVSRPFPIPPENLPEVLRLVGPLTTNGSVQTAQMGMARIIAHVVSSVMPAATLLAMLGFLLAPLFANLRHREASLLVLMLACGAAMIGEFRAQAY